jgi:6-phosphogluconolactonase
MQKTILTYNSLFEFESAAAAEIVRCMQAATAERNVCHCALTGGRTPAGIYRMLGSDPYKKQIDWKNVHLYFCDERMVPPSDAESNFGMAHRTLISHLPIAADHVHRIHGELRPDEAAAMYRRELATFMPGMTFDLMLLGIGEDGHTASLFPGTDAVEAEEEAVIAVFVPKLNAWRVTLTLPIINRSREILFLVAGRSKAEIISRLRSLGAPSKQLPSSLVRTETGTLIILCDAEASQAPVSGTIS